MSNARGKSLDNTHLSIDVAEKRNLIHRDYLAHTLRWTHVAKVLQRSGAYKSATVLDIGCGKELPLAKMLYSNRLMVKYYVGLEANRPSSINTEFFARGKFPLNAYGSSVFPDICEPCDNGFIIEGDKFPTPTHIVSFEVIEHIEPEHVIRFMKGIKDVMNEKTVAFISTPNYDPHVGAAANHVNEMKHELIGFMFEQLGFRIKERYGTFASIRDYKDQLEQDGHSYIFNRLRAYYDTNWLSNIFAPLYPHLSRNCLWVLDLPSPDVPVEKFYGYHNLTDTSTSSEHWEDFKAIYDVPKK